jgi:hypothetical protein
MLVKPLAGNPEHGPKTDSSNAFTPCARILDLGRSLFAHVAKALEGATPIFLGPCTLGRTLMAPDQGGRHGYVLYRRAEDE